jgi:2-polyprenyl-3-methyl-5-hydroxy-6-metoxy-1,4-benzoquinol methylase
VNTKPFDNGDDHSYHKCAQCRGVFVYPRRDQSYYINHKTYLTDPEDYIKLIDPKGFIWLLGKFEEAYNKKIGTRKGNMLEVGAGVGYFMMQAFAREWNVEGIETSKAASDWANKYLRMDVHNTTIEDFASTKKYDAIVMIEVLEHFLDAKKALYSTKKCVNGKALLFGTTPNTESKYWNKERNIYDSNDHIFLFSKKTIGMLFSELEIDSLSIEYFGGDKGDAHIMFSGIIHK